MRVLLTGANGFVGLNIVQALLDCGYQVAACVRATANIRYLEPMPVDIHKVDYNDLPTMKACMQACDYVIHSAGNTSCNEADIQELIEANVETTRNLLELARQTNIKRFVYTSTTSTIGSKKSQGCGATEHSKLRGFRARSPYARTKQEAERLVLMANTAGLDSIILNLAEVVGAYDHNLQWGRMVLAASQDKLPFIPPGGGSFCHARDAAQAHVNALTQGQPGSRYIIAGSDHLFKEFIDEIKQQLQAEFRYPNDNYFLLWLSAKAYEIFPFFIDKKPLVEAYRIRVFGGQHYFDSKKAVTELGYNISTLAEMVADCICWYKNHHFIS